MNLPIDPANFGKPQTTAMFYMVVVAQIVPTDAHMASLNCTEEALTRFVEDIQALQPGRMFRLTSELYQGVNAWEMKVISEDDLPPELRGGKC